MSNSTLGKQRYTRLLAVQKEIQALEEALRGQDVDKIVKDHIKALNEYNERKDACGVMIGKIADIENTTQAIIHP
ncbi:hypothetical protein EMMF5_002729 [Cystobasidiomycetes sp. EMM_F5]